jgi:hypothetical protein
MPPAGVRTGLHLDQGTFRALAQSGDAFRWWGNCMLEPAATDRSRTDRRKVGLGAALALLGVVCTGAIARAQPQVDLAGLPSEISSGVLAIQPQLRSTSVERADGSRLWLVDINPSVHEWLVLARAGAARGPVGSVHVENPLGTGQRVGLDRDGVYVERVGERTRCALTTDDGRDIFVRQPQPFVSWCNGNLLLRTQLSGYRTTEEVAVSLLRRMGPMGEAIINLYKTTVGADAGLEAAQAERRRPPDPGVQPPVLAEPGTPTDARIAPSESDTVLTNHRVGIRLLGAGAGPRPALRAGRWYRTVLQPGVAVSLIAPRQIDRAILQRDTDRASALDETEGSALVYLIAFDLEMLSVDFHVGTDHPDVDWSPRPQVARTNPRGPDGFDSVRPLARVGMVSPQARPRLAAIFAGGFKREHGAFRYGPLAQINQGTHYGFIEQGAVLSRLQPGLSTIITRLDGSLEMRTWTAQDNAGLPTIRSARQNGVPLVEPDPATGRPVPGANVRSWGLGNWSGALVIRTDPEGRETRGAELRSVRAGACLQGNAGHHFLIYAYFSAATPSAMARVFQAYGCEHGMLLDMNSPELTYVAVVGEEGTALEHLNQAMAESDPGRGIRRFLNANDNRDFFAVLRRPARQ